MAVDQPQMMDLIKFGFPEDDGQEENIDWTAWSSDAKKAAYEYLHNADGKKWLEAAKDRGGY